ncbi:uncharacterized protein LOC134287156 [Aedes albopictus]|uniref:Uncharacterized protein n=1 Tax=Aedes albopictus TaxID=7160 RepID=A0ABM2A113_AEDAL
MNCSCSSSQCPHVQYVRKLLETTEKDDQSATPQTTVQKALPQLQKAAWYVATAIKEIFFVWIAITKIVLRLWLNLLESNSYVWLAFLMFAFGLICSLPGVRATSMPTAVSTWSTTSEEDGALVGAICHFWR